jgi:beta-lactamase class A
MQRRGSNLLRWVSIVLLLGAVALFFYELLAYSRSRAHLPSRLTIAGVPVGGLTQDQAIERLLQTYSTPVELQYEDQIILLSPASVGFRPDTEVMLAAAELQRTGLDFWTGYWDFLWNRPGEASSIPLRAEYSSSQLENALRDVAARYDEPPIPAKPIPGSPNFSPGTPGRVLDISRAEELIGEVLQAPANRRVSLPILQDVSPRPSLSTLETLLKQNVDVAEFEGLMVVYLENLQTGEEIHFAYRGGQDLPTDPDVAFGAASIIKIGIMTAYYRYYDAPFNDETMGHMVDMITLSGNESTDWLMDRIEGERGPLVVTEVLTELGLESTFTAGYFYLGAPLLRVIRTPANQRLDVNTRPDIYTQTTPSEIGMLLSDIYACSNGGGTLLAVFPGEITDDECKEMIDLLSDNNIGILIEGGVPDGTRVAHKHGWPSSPFDMIGDAGIVFSPGGDYVLAVFLANEQEMIWEPTSVMFSEISRAVYNYFNPPLQ